MTFIDAHLAPARKTGQIKLHGPEAFEGMRRAGRLTAQALDALAERVRPGVTTDSLDEFIFDFAMSRPLSTWTGIGKHGLAMCLASIAFFLGYSFFRKRRWTIG